MPARWARGSSKVKTQARGSWARGSKDQGKGYYGFVSSFWCIFQRKLCPLLSKTPKISPAAGSSNVLLLFFVEKFQARRARGSSGAKFWARGSRARGLSKARRNYDRGGGSITPPLLANFGLWSKNLKIGAPAARKNQKISSFLSDFPFRNRIFKDLNPQNFRLRRSRCKIRHNLRSPNRRRRKC